MLLAFLAALAAPPVAASAAPDSLALARLSQPPKIDGQLDPGEWAEASRAELVYQVQPGDNVPPSERTEVWIGQDGARLCLAVLAHDKEPAGIRARVARRDDIEGDDTITIYLDTHDDRRRAYVFSFNPLGVQADGIYNEGTTVGRDYDSNVDLTWDGVLLSRGRLGPEGYVVEAAIPFETLRYDTGPDKKWGLHLRRFIARKAERVHWRPISRDASSLLVQMGSLTDLAAVPAKGSLDLIPTLTGDVTGTPGPDGRLRNESELEPGFTASWTPDSRIVLSGTVNPDFSQVEADVPQIQVNERFALFYPEKRPFFLEGDQYFRSPGALTILDTRRIQDPAWGAKLTGKTGRTSLGFLAADDRIPLSLRTGPAERRGFGVARVQRDIFANSTAGVFLTGAREDGASNTVLAADGQLRLPKGNVIGWQLARSWTEEGSRRFEGSATYVWYELQARHWRLFLNDLRVSDDYRIATGFLRRGGIRSNSGNFGYEFQPKAPSWYVTLRPFVVVKRLVTVEGLIDESYVDPGFDLRLPRDIRFYVYHSFHRDAFVSREFDYQFNVIDVTARPFKRASLDARVQWGEAVNFDPANAVVGDGWNASVGLTLKPIPAWSTELLWLTSRLSEKRDGPRLFQQDIYRVRTAYQFTRDVALRAIGEYDSLVRRVTLDLLASYTPRPNTALYLGYGDIQERQPDDEHRAEDRYRPIRRAFFVKLSYGYRR